MNYNIFVFLEIIESIQGIQFLSAKSADGVSARLYQGLTGKLVIIDTTDQDPTDSACKGFLKQLGLEDYIDGMFPPK
jgi:hypothetical protein